MANTITSPNMNLPVPVVGADPGPDWSRDLNSCLALIDSHTHTSGSGVLITPSAMSISSDVPMNNNNLTLSRSVRYQIQSTTLSASDDVGSTYVTGVDLYFRDINGNNVRITQSGGVAGSPGSIGSLSSPATATYVAANSTFVFQSDALTSANLDGASVLMRNLTASSFALTLSPPNAMGANYTLTLPALPAQTNVMTLDVSGNMGSMTYDAVGSSMTSVGANAIAATMTATGANAVAASRTRATGASVVAGGVASSASCGSFTTASQTAVAVTNLSVTLVTSGRPVMLMLQNDGLAHSLISVGSSSGNGSIRFLRASSTLSEYFAGGGIWTVTTPGFIDVVAAGTYTYSITAFAGGVGSYAIDIENYILVAYEL